MSTADAIATLERLQAFEEPAQIMGATIGALRAYHELANQALDACLQYDHWKREIDRLTKEIKGCVCPREEPPKPFEPDPDWRQEPSHYSDAKERLEAEREALRPDGPYPSEKVYLEDIEAEVSDCPACSRLCRLIRDRKHARQRWGVAKRAVRHAARKARKAEGGGP